MASAFRAPLRREQNAMRPDLSWASGRDLGAIKHSIYDLNQLGFVMSKGSVGEETTSGAVSSQVTEKNCISISHVDYRSKNGL